MALQYEKDGKPSGSESKSRRVGLVGNVNYSYDNRYYIDFNVRTDGSSQFGSSKRFAPFYSVGLGWNIHNENFFLDNPYVNRLKLRASYGMSGSQQFSSYQLWRLIPITRVIVIIFGWVLIKWLWEIRIWNGKLR